MLLALVPGANPKQAEPSRTVHTRFGAAVPWHAVACRGRLLALAASFRFQSQSGVGVRHGLADAGDGPQRDAARRQRPEPPAVPMAADGGRWPLAI